MIDFKNKGWAEFKISDIFKLESKNSISNSQNLPNGDYPLISARKIKNGVDGFIDTEKLNNGQVITWNKQGDGGAGLSFYQPSTFANKSTVFVLRPKINLTKNQILFIIPLLNKYHDIFSHGYGLTKNRFNVLKFILPINNENSPDWNFMEEYIQSKFNKIQSMIHLPKMNEITDFRELHEVEWGNFTIEEIAEVKSGKDWEAYNRISGNCPFIGASSINNGVTDFVDFEGREKNVGSGVISINRNGSVGYAFYHPYNAYFSGDTRFISLKNQKHNKYVNLFISRMIISQKDKYAFGYKLGSERIKRQTIKLPIKNNKLDYGFMEQYIKRLENKILVKVKID